MKEKVDSKTMCFGIFALSGVPMQRKFRAGFVQLSSADSKQQAHVFFDNY
jgi:hypothetical protein